MPKIDAYFRSIERFAATGAVLASGQSVVLRFAAGDRQATQMTPHDILVSMVREVAPPPALSSIDANRPARFEVESNGARYTLAVTPKPGAWQVTIDPSPHSLLGSAAHPGRAGAIDPSPHSLLGSAAHPGRAGAIDPSPHSLLGSAAHPGRAGAIDPSSPMQAAAISTTLPPTLSVTDTTSGVSGGTTLAIERGQYDDSSDLVSATATTTTSGSALLDQLIQNARANRATDIYLGAGRPPLMRVGGELCAMSDRSELDGETLSRELGIMAPADARGAWSQRGTATFAYGDGGGRVRVTLMSDHRGPGAALRLLVAEPVAMDRLGVPPQVSDWLGRRGLVVVAGGSGSGKTTAVAALVHALADLRRRVICFEVAIEIAHTSPAVSQRRLGKDVDSIAHGVTSAMMEGVDAIVVDPIDSSEAAGAIVDAVAGGHLVIATMAAMASDAEAQLIERVAAERRGLARAVIEPRLLGVVGITGTAARRTFELVPRHRDND